MRMRGGASPGEAKWGQLSTEKTKPGQGGRQHRTAAGLQCRATRYYSNSHLRKADKQTTNISDPRHEGSSKFVNNLKDNGADSAPSLVPPNLSARGFELQGSSPQHRGSIRPKEVALLCSSHKGMAGTRPMMRGRVSRKVGACPEIGYSELQSRL